MEGLIEDQIDTLKIDTETGHEEMTRLKKDVETDPGRREEMKNPVIIAIGLDHLHRPVVRGVDPLVPHTDAHD